MTKTAENWVAIIMMSASVGVPAALALQGEPPWVIVLSGLSAAAAVVAGQLGLSKPSESAQLRALRRPPEAPLYDSHKKDGVP